jgi:hypothetical protein
MKSAALWDAEFKAGKLAFLHRPAELKRFAEIGAMVDRASRIHGPVEIADIGSGEGLILNHLPRGAVKRYLAVDISGVALKAIRDGQAPVARVRASLADWDGRPEPVSPRILIASEVLYYDNNGVAQLRRLAVRVPRTVEVIVSCVSGRPDKPNWTTASERLWRELRATGWRRIEMTKVSDARSSLQWDIARFAV